MINAADPTKRAVQKTVVSITSLAEKAGKGKVSVSSDRMEPAPHDPTAYGRIGRDDESADFL